MMKSSSESSLMETVKTKPPPPVRKISSHSSLSADDEPESLSVIILFWPRILQPQTLALIHKLSKNPSDYPFILPQQTLIETTEEPETEETLDTAYTKATTESCSLFKTFKAFNWSANDILDDHDHGHDLQKLLNYYLSYHLSPLLYTINTDPNAVIEELDDTISQHQMTISLLQNSLDNSAIQLVAQMEDFLKLHEEIKNKRETMRINKCLHPVAAHNKAAWLCHVAVAALSSAAAAAALYAFKRLHSSR